MKVEVFSTGGGIWLAETDLNNGTYAVVDSEYMDCLSVYRYTDDEQQYMPEDMIFSKGAAELNDDERTIYNKLCEELNRRK